MPEEIADHGCAAQYPEATFSSRQRSTRRHEQHADADADRRPARPERPDEHAVTLRRVVPSVDADACIIGAGPNGLVASIALADAGWDVVLVEGSHLGGAVRSVRRRPETVTDLFSAFYPLAASPVLRALELDRHGLQWSHADVVLAHPADEKTTEAAALYRDVRQTAKQLEHDHPGDGERWQELFAEWQRLREPLLDALFSPFPPMRPAARLARLLGLADGLRLARFLLLPVRRMGEELFRASTADCFTGNALHADVPLTAPVSGTFGWLLALGQDVGFSAPRGGAGRCPTRCASARAAGVEILVGTPVEDVLVAGGRAVGARLADGRLIRSRRAVLAAIDAETLLRELVPRTRCRVDWSTTWTTSTATFRRSRSTGLFPDTTVAS